MNVDLLPALDKRLNLSHRLGGALSHSLHQEKARCSSSSPPKKIPMNYACLLHAENLICWYPLRVFCVPSREKLGLSVF